MRISFRLYFQKNTYFEPNYRQYFLSLFKEAFKNSSEDGKDFFHRYYGEKTIKPFTFSVYMPCKPVDKKLKLEGEYINLFFSTNDYEFLMRLYNGLLKISKRKDPFNLGKNKIEKIANINLLKEVKITKDTVSFKTLSPLLIRDPDDGSKYLIPEFCNANKEFSLMKKVSKEKFIEGMKISSEKLVKNFLNKDEKMEFHIDESTISMIPVIHGSKNEKSHEEYMINYPAIKGHFKIEAKPDVLQLFYDIGIGARRSEGFGMLEVVE